MIHYSVHDCLATTYLIRPILEKWSLERVKNINSIDVFQAFKSTTPPPLSQLKKKIKKNIDPQKFIRIYAGDELEPISDDEIYVSQLIIPTNEQPDEVEHEPIDVDLITSVSPDETIEQTPQEHVQLGNEPGEQLQQQSEQSEENQDQPLKRTRSSRSNARKKKQNKKRNDKIKLGRYRYQIRRDVYHRFPMPMLRFVLRRHGIIKIKHIKIDDKTGKLVIGMKTEDLRQETEHRLSMKIFNEESYYYYRSKFYQRRT